MVSNVGLTDSVGFACLEDLQLSNSYMWGTAISLDYCGRVYKRLEVWSIRERIICYPYGKEGQGYIYNCGEDL